MKYVIGVSIGVSITKNPGLVGPGLPTLRVRRFAQK